jgi:hypothetical protein
LDPDVINPEDPLVAFAIALLDDGEGISKDAFEKFMAILLKQGESDLFWFLDRNVKMDRDRCFLPASHLDWH